MMRFAREVESMLGEIHILSWDRSCLIFYWRDDGGRMCLGMFDGACLRFPRFDILALQEQTFSSVSLLLLRRPEL